MSPARFQPHVRRRSAADPPPSPSELAHAITTFGFAANERHVEQFARRLMAAGEVPRLTAVMLDRAAAPVVRERAFARAAVALQGPRRISYVA